MKYTAGCKITSEDSTYANVQHTESYLNTPLVAFIWFLSVCLSLYCLSDLFNLGLKIQVLAAHSQDSASILMGSGKKERGYIVINFRML